MINILIKYDDMMVEILINSTIIMIIMNIRILYDSYDYDF